MDAEQLRSTYNEYFSQSRNLWSSTDLKRTLKIARRTMKWLREFGLNKKALKVLDVGCGTGFYTESFRKLGCDTIGLDYSEIALEKAMNHFPDCRFIQMNGFEPKFSECFDMVFCRGFSGANTHDLVFIAQWINRYMQYINQGGFFIFSYSSNFTGKEKEGETVNLTMEEILSLVRLIDGNYRGIHFFYYFGLLSKIKKALRKKLMKKTEKEYYSLFIQKL